MIRPELEVHRSWCLVVVVVDLFVRCAVSHLAVPAPKSVLHLLRMVAYQRSEPSLTDLLRQGRHADRSLDVVGSRTYPGAHLGATAAKAAFSRADESQRVARH